MSETVENAIVRNLTQKTRLSGLRELAERIKVADPPYTEEELAVVQEAVAWPGDEDV